MCVRVPLCCKAVREAQVGLACIAEPQIPACPGRFSWLLAQPVPHLPLAGPLEFTSPVNRPLVPGGLRISTDTALCRHPGSPKVRWCSGSLTAARILSLFLPSGTPPSAFVFINLTSNLTLHHPVPPRPIFFITSHHPPDPNRLLQEELRVICPAETLPWLPPSLCISPAPQYPLRHHAF